MELKITATPSVRKTFRDYSFFVVVERQSHYRVRESKHLHTSAVHGLIL